MVETASTSTNDSQMCQGNRDEGMTPRTRLIIPIELIDEALEPLALPPPPPPPPPGEGGGVGYLLTPDY